jgi:uncharacterized protein (AIM24 family)
VPFFRLSLVLTDFEAEAADVRSTLARGRAPNPCGGFAGAVARRAMIGREATITSVNLRGKGGIALVRADGKKIERTQ